QLSSAHLGQFAQVLAKGFIEVGAKDEARRNALTAQVLGLTQNQPAHEVNAKHLLEFNRASRHIHDVADSLQSIVQGFDLVRLDFSNGHERCLVDHDCNSLRSAEAHS